VIVIGGKKEGEGLGGLVGKWPEPADGCIKKKSEMVGSEKALNTIYSSRKKNRLIQGVKKRAPERRELRGGKESASKDRAGKDATENKVKERCQTRRTI